MSIIQASVHAHHAIVVADTWTHYHNEADEKVGAGHGSKLLPVPHMPAVIAMRGYPLLPSMVAGSAFMVPDFDTLVNSFGATMGVSMERVSDAFPAARGLMYAEVEMVLVGWSHRARMMLAIHATGPNWPSPSGGGFPDVQEPANFHTSITILPQKELNCLPVALHQGRQRVRIVSPRCVGGSPFLQWVAPTWGGRKFLEPSPSGGGFRSTGSAQEEQAGCTGWPACQSTGAPVGGDASAST